MGRVVRNPAFKDEYRAEAGPEWQDRAGPIIESSIGAATPLQTGFAKANYRSESFTDSDGNPAIRTKNHADYLAYPDQGTGIYGKYGKPITPTVAKVLSWIQDGERVFARSVKGQKGQHFFRKGLEAVCSRVVEYKWGKPGT